MNIQPLGAKLILKLIKKEEEVETDAGIIIKYDHNNDDVEEWEVLSAGPGEPDRNGVFIATTVKPGQKVAVAKFGGQVFHIRGEMYQIIREHEILGIINE